MASADDKIIAEFKEIIGSSCVIFPAAAQSGYGFTTLGGDDRKIRGALLPQQVEEIIQIVKIAAKYRVPLYPISIGNNWGYGSKSPVVDGCVVLDLSRMNRILAVDKDLGLVTVEPGVTFGQLQSYIDSHEMHYLAPVNGGGAHCSILGNALEKGVVAGPDPDHLASLKGLEAVLPDGTMYRSSSRDPMKPSSSIFKWGVGPYLDGLFTQSNFGIVVNATFELVSRPDHAEVFLLPVRSEELLGPTVDAVRNTLQRLGGVLSRIHIQNDRRIFTRLALHPGDAFLENGLIRNDIIDNYINRISLTKWSILGVLHGERHVIDAARQSVRRILKPYARRISFYGERKIKWATMVLQSRLVPKQFKKRFFCLPMIMSFFSTTTGKSASANPLLPLWPQKDKVQRILHFGPSASDMDFNLDSRCGLVFFSAIMPMMGSAVASFAKSVDAICRDHHIEPLLSFMNLSDRCLYVPLPLLFDKSDPSARQRVQKCYRALVEAGNSTGVQINRVGIDEMESLVQSERKFFEVAQKVKQALDPLDIISPGRYSLRK